MQTYKKWLIFSGIVVGVVVLVGVMFMNRQQLSIDNDLSPQVDPIDFVLDFYGGWQRIVAADADPFASDLFASGVFAQSFREQLVARRADDTSFDPVTCQSVVTDRVRIRPLTNTDNTVTLLAEFRIGSDSLPTFALLSLKSSAGDWQIHDIECTAGDVPPDVEFSVDRKGFLLKNVPPPYENGVWHLVYEQDGQMGYVMPLIFSESTICVTRGGEESVCNIDTLQESTEVYVQGEMTETGATISRLEVI
jgi:hypothetical protein